MVSNYKVPFTTLAPHHFTGPNISVDEGVVDTDDERETNRKVDERLAEVFGGDPSGDPAGFDTSQAEGFPFSKDPMDALGAFGTGSAIGSLFGFHNDINMSASEAQEAAESRSTDNKTTVAFELGKINNRKAQAKYRDAHHSGANLGFAQGTIGAAHASSIQFGEDISPGAYGNIGTSGSYSLPGTNYGLGINDRDVVDLTPTQVETMTAHMQKGVEKGEARSLAIEQTMEDRISRQTHQPGSKPTPAKDKSLEAVPTTTTPTFSMDFSSKDIGGSGAGVGDPSTQGSVGTTSGDRGGPSGKGFGAPGGPGDGLGFPGGPGGGLGVSPDEGMEADLGIAAKGGKVNYQEGGFAPPPEAPQMMGPEQPPEMGGEMPPELMAMLGGPEAGFAPQPQQPPSQSIPIIVGMVQGPGTEDSDSIQTRVPANSYVVNADAVQTVGIKKLQKMLEEGMQATGWKPDPEDPSLEVINVSKGEFVFPGPFVEYFGVETFDKINDKGFAQSGATQKRREQGVEGTGESIPEETLTPEQMQEMEQPAGFYGGGYTKDKYESGGVFVEEDFQTWIKNTPWYKEFINKHGEEPNLNTNMYDYRGAYKAGVSPQIDPESGEYHWPSRNPKTGQLLKGENHPTRWKNDIAEGAGFYGGGSTGDVKDKPQTDLSKGGFNVGGSTDPEHGQSYNPNFMDAGRFGEEARQERSKLSLKEQLELVGPLEENFYDALERGAFDDPDDIAADEITGDNKMGAVPPGFMEPRDVPSEERQNLLERLLKGVIPFIDDDKIKEQLENIIDGGGSFKDGVKTEGKSAAKTFGDWAYKHKDAYGFLPSMKDIVDFFKGKEEKPKKAEKKSEDIKAFIPQRKPSYTKVLGLTDDDFETLTAMALAEGSVHVDDEPGAFEGPVFVALNRLLNNRFNLQPGKHYSKNAQNTYDMVTSGEFEEPEQAHWARDDFDKLVGRVKQAVSQSIEDDPTKGARYFHSGENENDHHKGLSLTTKLGKHWYKTDKK